VAGPNFFVRQAAAVTPSLRCDLNFLYQALRLTSEVLGRSALIIGVVELQSGLHGRFQVTLDGDLAFSKATPLRARRGGPLFRVDVGSR